jgi:hypothetical protein
LQKLKCFLYKLFGSVNPHRGQVDLPTGILLSFRRKRLFRPTMSTLVNVNLAFVFVIAPAGKIKSAQGVAGKTLEMEK